METASIAMAGCRLGHPSRSPDDVPRHTLRGLRYCLCTEDLGYVDVLICHLAAGSSDSGASKATKLPMLDSDVRRAFFSGHGCCVYPRGVKQNLENLAKFRYISKTKQPCVV